MKIIWALFDDANRSYYKALKENDNVKVYSIGINDLIEDNYFKIDLSILNNKLIKQLSKLPKPDIILASPPCESWSGADCGGKMFYSIDSEGNWLIRNSQYYDRYNQTCNKVKRRSFINKEINRLIGETTIAGTITIINHFKPKYWVIENPQTSKIWDYINYHWNFEVIKNLATYSSYDSNFSLKPTIFASNIDLGLKNERIVGNKNHMNSNYSQRSNIPYKLIQDIIKKMG